MVSPSFSKALKNYTHLLDLSSHWISRYYKKNFKVLGVDVEKVQAFSQFYFFSLLLEKLPIKDIWTSYPEVGKDERSIISRCQSRVFDIFKELLSNQSHLEEIGDGCDVMIVANGRHADDLMGLMCYLNDKFKILVAGKLNSEAQKTLGKEKINYVNILDGRRFLGKLTRLKLILKYTFENWSLEKQANTLMSEQQWHSRLWYLRPIQFPEIEALILLANKLIRLYKPKIIFTTTSNDMFGAAFTLTAQAIGLRVAEIQHGITVWKEIESEFYNSDYYLVWGEISKKMHPKNAVVVGSPYFEKSQIKNQPLRNLDSKHPMKILILWTPPFGTVSVFKAYPHEQVFSEMLIGLKKLPLSWTITIRSHPSFSLDDFVKSKKLPVNIKIDKRKDVWDSIKLHDIVITQPTTAGLIAIFQKKPLLYFDSSYLFEKYSDPYVKYNCALNIPIKDLVNADKYVFKLLNDQDIINNQLKAQQNFAYNYCKYIGEDSYKKIADFLNDTIRNYAK